MGTGHLNRGPAHHCGQWLTPTPERMWAEDAQGTRKEEWVGHPGLSTHRALLLGKFLLHSETCLPPTLLSGVKCSPLTSPAWTPLLP